MLKKTILRNEYWDGQYDEWFYVDDDAYVVDGYSIRSLLNYLEKDGHEPWYFSNDAVFNVKSRYLVVVDTISTYCPGCGTVKVFNLDRLRHQRRHERDALPYMFSWKYGL